MIWKTKKDGFCSLKVFTFLNLQVSYIQSPGLNVWRSQPGYIKEDQVISLPAFLSGACKYPIFAAAHHVYPFRQYCPCPVQ